MTRQQLYSLLNELLEARAELTRAEINFQTLNYKIGDAINALFPLTRERNTCAHCDYIGPCHTCPVCVVPTIKEK